MGPEHAAQILGVAPGASSEERHRVFQEKRELLEKKLALAPTPGLKAKYREALDELTAAFELLELSQTEYDLGALRPDLRPTAVDRPEEPEPQPADTLQADKAPSVARSSRRKRAVAIVTPLVVLAIAIPLVVRGNSPRTGRAHTVPGIELEMVWIEPGSFAMGSPETEDGRDADETRHMVTISRGFWLGKYEVTQAQWNAIMGNNPSRFRDAGETAPVESVSWDDATSFCRVLTRKEREAGGLPEGHQYTLPTEAQWEYACRAHSQGPYAGDIRLMAWYNANSGGMTHAVGQKQANLWGLHDMHGNVWEWCWDWYGNYPSVSVTDPTGPSSGANRVYRGGGWNLPAAICRSANRNWNSPGYRNSRLGFRLALISVR